MESDAKTSPIIRGMFEEAFWTPTNEIGTDILTMGHVIPFFVALAFGLSLSVIAVTVSGETCRIHINFICLIGTTFTAATNQDDRG